MVSKVQLESAEILDSWRRVGTLLHRVKNAEERLAEVLVENSFLCREFDRLVAAAMPPSGQLDLAMMITSQMAEIRRLEARVRDLEGECDGLQCFECDCQPRSST